MKYFLCLLVGLFVGSAGAAEYGAEIFLQRTGDKFAYLLTVENTSNALLIDSFEVQLGGSTRFDSSTETTIPDLGVDNDAISSSTVLWNLVNGLDPLEIKAITGDIDGSSPSIVIARVFFSNGEVRSVNMPIFVGPFPFDEWSGTISEGATTPPDPPPVGPIIDGEGTATLSWTAATERESGDPLPIEEIANYTLYWGETSGNYSDEEIIPNTATTYEITFALTQDTTFYFAMTTVDTDGQESVFSNETAKSFVLVVDPPDPIDPPNPPLVTTVTITVTCTTTETGLVCSFTQIP